MSQRIVRLLALSAGMAFSVSALGQGITATAPRIDGPAAGATNIEFIGVAGAPNTFQDADQRIVLTFAAGTTAIADNAANAVLQIQFQDAAGANVGVPLSIGPDDNSGTTGLFRDLAGGNASIAAGETWSFDISGILANVPASAALMQVTWSPAGDNVSLTTNADGLLNGAGDDATDQRYELVRTAPVFSGAFVSGTGAATNCALVFTRPTIGRGTNQTTVLMIDGDANNPNDTVAGGGAATDLTFVDSSNIASQQFNSNVAPASTADINAGSFSSLGGGVAVQFTFDSAISSLDTFGARFSTTGASTLRDASGNRVVGMSFQEATANNRGFVLTSALADLNVTSAVFTTTTNIRVTFNNPLNNTPTADFFDLNLSGSGAVDLSLGGVGNGIAAVVDTIANDNILDLTTNLPGELSVTPSGICDDANGNAGTFDADGRSFVLTLSETTGTTDAQDIFGGSLAGASTSGTATATATDGIAPTLQAVGYLDQNRDGDVDAVYLRYDEPMGTVSAATGVTLIVNNGVTVNPFRQVNTATGALVTDTTSVTGATDDMAITSTTVGTVDPVPGTAATIPDLEPNNSVIFAFNPQTFDWDTGGVALATEAVPGTGDDNVMNIAYDATIPAAGTRIRDAAGNEAATVGATNAGEDRAAPVGTFARFFTGDNMFGAGTDQFFSEQDGTLADATNNNRLVFFAGENFGGGVAAANVNEGQVRVGVGGAGDLTLGAASDNAVFLGVSANAISFVNNNSSPLLVPGATVSILPGSGVRDGDNNEMTLADTVTQNRVAPYLPLVATVNGATVDAAFLFDADNDGFADSARLTMTQPIDSATVQLADFTLSLGTITAATVQGTDIVLAITDGVVPMTSVITGTYNGSADSTPIASTATGGTGVAMTATNDTFDIRRIASPDRATQELAFMDIVGMITTDGTTPVPPGTKIFAMNAVPAIYSATATHNNLSFTVDMMHDDSASIYAWNAWLYGIQEFLYLGRDHTNKQVYRNEKYNFTTNTDDAVNTYKDVVALTINASNLTNITFTGTGETSNDKVANGRVRLCWDVIRSSTNTVQNFYNNYTNTAVRSFASNGNPIVSSAVVNGTDGRFELHHSAPTSLFNGLSRLSAVGRPVILVVELPNGQRYAVSGVNASINGAPLNFAIQNRAQTTNAANNATSFNVNLANVGAVPVYEGWNIIPFNRNSGWATNSGSRPVRVNGVSEAAIVVPGTSNPAQPFAGPLDQFVWWGESTVDGMWTRSEDANFSNIIIDPDFFPYFAFTMTSFGVQAGSAMTNLVGGYALGFFQNGDWYSEYGIFQFGAPLSGNTLFSGADAATTFPNNATTQGWGLFTSKAAFNPATGIRGTNNPDLDFIFMFRNNGPNASTLNRTTIEVSSLDLVAPTGTDNPNDTAQIDAGQGFFGHFTP